MLSEDEGQQGDLGVGSAWWGKKRKEGGGEGRETWEEKKEGIKAGTYRELRDGVVHDVERVVLREVEGDLDEERGAVDHAGLDDEHEHLEVLEGWPDEGVADGAARDEPACMLVVSNEV